MDVQSLSAIKKLRAVLGGKLDEVNAKLGGKLDSMSDVVNNIWGGHPLIPRV